MTITLEQTDVLLTVAVQLGCRYSTSEAEAEAWHRVLAPTGLEARDLAAALQEHAATSTAELKPAHLTIGARRIRDRRVGAEQQAEQLRLERSTHAVPKPHNFDAITAEAAAKAAAGRGQVANQREVLAALRAKPAPAERLDADQRRAAVRADLAARRALLATRAEEGIA